MSPSKRRVMKIPGIFAKGILFPSAAEAVRAARRHVKLLRLLKVKLKIRYHDKLRYPVAGAYLARMPLLKMA